ncbi:Siroheme synthase [Serratia marcescens]|nr:Siroheme synthase [Serratia marcescens]
MDYLPIFCQLQHKACLLVGGGEIAERKARLLLDAGAALTVNALAFSPQFHHWAGEGLLTLAEGEFSPALLAEKWLVIAATDRLEVNALVYQCANQQRVFCNVVDDPKRASFIMPSIIDRSPIMVAVSSGGKAPVLARLLREKLEAMLPQHLGKLAQLGGSLRQRVKQRFSSLGARRRFWERLFAHDRLAQSLANDDAALAERQLEQLFSERPEDRGEVVLVGAGPGDAGLLTLKGLQQIQQADVVVYDRLVSEEIMTLVRRDAERIFVGKRAGHHCVPQEQINQILLQQALQGKRVVRLKGGDPFIFGRGGEELETLADANVPFSVVPGITAASGCSAYSGIPLTHRDHAQSVRLVTGHAKADGGLDWATLAATPVALVENGTSCRQRVIEGELGQLGALSLQAASPSLIIVGSVVSLRSKLNWFASEEPPAGLAQMA